MDDLTKIKGIGPATAKKLIAAGVTTFAALAALSPASEHHQSILAGVTAEEINGWIAEAKEVLGRGPDGAAANTPGGATGGDEKKGKVARQEFAAVSPIDLDGKSYAIGKTISLTRETYEQLKPSGAIEGNWTD